MSLFNQNKKLEKCCSIYICWIVVQNHNKDMWKCSRCTYLNRNYSNKCEICDDDINPKFQWVSNNIFCWNQHCNVIWSANNEEIFKKKFNRWYGVSQNGICMSLSKCCQKSHFVFLSRLTFSIFIHVFYKKMILIYVHQIFQKYV